ncbi:PREDICTED: transmembrane protein 8A [Miniopterus natalensis]|uniref:transmembrane protein 8A n=1 Tax=Miniopterus natalensis TaxID=291302 RepID=UPI0007A70122|nr:PREDICTED: transmembrane protein 8A [Miniopterus natalensis]
MAPLLSSTHWVPATLPTLACSRPSSSRCYRAMLASASPTQHLGTGLWLPTCPPHPKRLRLCSHLCLRLPAWDAGHVGSRSLHPGASYPFRRPSSSTPATSSEWRYWGGPASGFDGVGDSTVLTVGEKAFFQGHPLSLSTLSCKANLIIPYPEIDNWYLSLQLVCPQSPECIAVGTGATATLPPGNAGSSTSCLTSPWLLWPWLWPSTPP